MQQFRKGAADVLHHSSIAANLAKRRHGERRHRFSNSRDGHRDDSDSCLLRHRERSALELP